MGIKVVQGLIDVGGPLSQTRTDRQNQLSNPSSATQAQQSASVQQQQQRLVLSQASATYSEAVVFQTVRSSKDSSDEGSLSNPGDAHDLADSIAERVTHSEEEASQAHGALSSTNAREHFAA